MHSTEGWVREKINPNSNVRKNRAPMSVDLEQWAGFFSFSQVEQIRCWSSFRAHGWGSRWPPPSRWAFSDHGQGWILKQKCSLNIKVLLACFTCLYKISSNQDQPKIFRSLLQIKTICPKMYKNPSIFSPPRLSSKCPISWRTPCWTQRLFQRIGLSYTVCGESWRCPLVHSRKLQLAYWNHRHRES